MTDPTPVDPATVPSPLDGLADEDVPQPWFHTPPPDAGLKTPHAPRLLGGALGDGYGLKIPDGINVDLITTDVTWSLLLFADADAMEQFLVDRKGTEFFYWQKPREAGPRKWRCSKWSKTENQTEAQITATLEEQPL